MHYSYLTGKVKGYVMVFLSFGGGVQSSVMLMMSIRGDIERPDHVIFADTGWEGNQTLSHVEWSRRQCEKAGIPFHTVSNGNIRENMINAKTQGDEFKGRWVSMPLFVVGDGINGMIPRQCTNEHKITPIKRKERELLGYKPRQRIPAGSCEVMIGVSTDESRRAIPAKDAWIDNIYPLIDPLKMSRVDCQKWWEDHYSHRKLAKSSCVGCPYNSDRRWLEMKTLRPDDWADVVEFDELIRNVSGAKGKNYLHRSHRPIGDVDFNDGQSVLDLEDEIYCAGGCGL